MYSVTDFGVMGRGLVPWGAITGLTPSGKPIVTQPYETTTGVVLRHNLLSVDGPQEHVETRLADGHWFATPSGERATFHLFSDLDMNGRPSQPWHSNEAGMAIGTIADAQTHWNPIPFLWDGSRFHDLSVIGSPHQGIAAATSISAEGSIVGNGFFRDGPSSGWHDAAFLYRDGDLAELPFRNAFDINDGDQIVGTTGSKAVLYENGQSFDLNDLIPPTVEWTLTSAIAINNSGQILTLVSNHSDYFRLLVLSPTDDEPIYLPLPDQGGGSGGPIGVPTPTPVPSPPEPVPETAPIAVLALGLVAFGWRRFRAPR